MDGVPHPVEKSLAGMEAALTSVESSLAPLLRGPPSLPALVPTLAPLDSARLHLALASSTAVLLASHLRLSGVDTGTHAIAQDFAALQKLNARVKQVAALVKRGEEAAAAEGAQAAGAAAEAAQGVGGSSVQAVLGAAAGGMEVVERGGGAGPAARPGFAPGFAPGGVGQPRGGPSTALNVEASRRFLAAGLGKRPEKR
jgi:hypothetical protein